RGQPHWRGSELQRNDSGLRTSDRGRARLGVSRPRPLLAVAADPWIGHLVRDSVPRAPPKAAGGEHYAHLPHLFFYSALSIPLFYAVGLLAHPRTDFAIADFWRFWVVHLWVEDFLELFTTVMVAYIFVLLGIVSAKTATRVVYLDILLYS